MMEELQPLRVAELAGLADRMIRAEGIARIGQARERGLLKARLAHWEVAELFRHCLPLAIHDALRQPDFDSFRALWLPLAGAEAANWLPPLYLAAVSSPCFDASVRLELVQSALAYVDNPDDD